MARLFDRNMFIMLLAIMVGVIIITYFIADIQSRTKIEYLTSEHESKIHDLESLHENFTNHFLQGSILMDSAREIREVGNYHFDFGLFWYNTALSQNVGGNETTTIIDPVVNNCTTAMTHYLTSFNKFDDSQQYFIDAATFTNVSRYLEVIGYYIQFSESGKNITMLRYNASQYLMYAAENLSLGNIGNLTELMELFNETQNLYDAYLDDYEHNKGRIDDYWFFDEIREPH
jgi:hypothetical protein